MVRLLIFLGLLLCVSGPMKGRPVSAKIKTIFIGVDGVSREEFDHARNKLGLFPRLRHARTHIATFPSISDYSWNVMVGSQAVKGPRGKIRTYEAAHFHRERNEVVSDPREYFRRLGEDHHYFTGAFRHWLNPFVESLLYIPTEELPKLELRQLLSAVKEDKRDLVTVMVASSDALAHTRADGSKFLIELDKFISDLEVHYREKKVPVEIILASDHGQASRFHPGEQPLPLKGVDISPVLKRAGVTLKSRLEDESDIVLPMMALANYGTVHFRNPAHRSQLLNELRKENWFSLAVHRTEISGKNITMSISDSSGEARLKIRKGTSYSYFYSPVTANPLEIPAGLHNRWLTDREAREGAGKTQFPDSFYRLAFSGFEEEASFLDLIFTMKDEYYLAGELNSFTTMYQTHGSLGRRSSAGILASNRPLRTDHEELRTNEVLAAVGLTPQDLFRSTEENVLPAPAGQIATGSEEWTNRRIFALMNRAVQDSRYVFDGKSFDAVLEVVKPLLNHRSPEVNSVKWREAVSLSDVAHLVDLMIRNGNVEKIKTDERFLKIQARLAGTGKSSTRAPSAEATHWHTHDLVKKAGAAKKLVMKSYAGFFFLEKALTLPEFPFIADERKNPAGLKTSAEIFAETFRERSLLEDIYPTEFSLNWKPILPPEQVTLVYVPGIYNSLFDDEIFRSGLDQLTNKWGVRILTPKVFSTCSSGVNGKILIEELKRDLAAQESIGKHGTKYFIIGYSKGGVDSLHAFTQDTDFVSRHVHGLLAMASPIQGTSILNKSDLPLEVMQLLGPEKAPEICATEERASKSINPAGAQSFLRKNLAALAGLTRYYSLSFVSDMRSSHLFMKATKNIARFGEPNDGVVSLSASRFPNELGATDLGVVSADHLSGIVASHFPQKALFESVLFTLGRSGAFSGEANAKINEGLMYAAKSVSPERFQKYVTTRIAGELSGVFKEDADLSQLTDKIRMKLAETAFALRPFSLVRKKMNIHVSFRDGRWPALTDGSSVKVEDEKELVRLFLTSLQSSGKNLFRNKRPAIPESSREPASPPANELGYHEDLRLNLRDLDKFIGGKRVRPVTNLSHPHGITFAYDHASSTEFRNEYQLSFEDCAPADADDNSHSGWESIVKDKKVWAKLSSANSSIRLSTYSWRFLAADYPELDLDLQVNDDVDGANVLFGGDGKDDSAFQLWFTFRILDDSRDREYLSAEEKMMTIGYYFGDEIPGQSLEINSIYKNYYSEKDFVVAKLPAAKQKLIGIGKDMLGTPFVSRHNLLEDIRRAYPDIDPSKAEIVAITIQHDSNDTRGKSEAFFSSFSLKPSARLTVKAD